MPETPVLVVFSHLRWDFVYQRPQHVLSRLSQQWPVFYIEEPVLDPGEPHWEFSVPQPGVTVCRPHTPVEVPGFSDEQLPVLRRLVTDLVGQRHIGRAIVWFYTPLGLPLADNLPLAAMVYDCMDELSLFLNAPPSLHTLEAELLAKADVVFTGGQSLYQAKRGRAPNLYCFPSSVDADHFRPARATANPPLDEPDDQWLLPHPRLGYYGVIDERMDLPLLGALAEAHPEWQIVMIGPVVKIDPARLPRAVNLHYLGQRPYADLPRYLSGWDVCLLPFARNNATRFISPTKTLEYMAAERMIVSTPITDVAGPYRDLVFLGDSVDGFVNACERALAVSPQERATRVRAMQGVLARTSWQATATAMTMAIQQALTRRAAQPALTTTPTAAQAAYAATPGD